MDTFVTPLGLASISDQDPWAKAHPIIVEEKKSDNERGYYQHPQLYDQPEEKSIDFARHPKIMHYLKEQEN